MEAAKAETPDLLNPGQSFGVYTVVRRLGKGGMGMVYLLEHPTDGLFAVKIIHPEALKKDPEFVVRFAREGAFAMKIRHPNLIAVYDMGQDPDTGYYYLIMDYLPGGDVRQKLNELGRFPIDEAVRIVAQVANALVEAHRHGVIHRDIKPGNIMFDANGTPKLADLGVAKFSDAGQAMLTSADVMIGTPAYMAPEQIMDSHGVDQRADVYSLGIVFFEMLTGRRPNEGLTVLQIVAQAVEGRQIPDVRIYRAEIPAMIAQLLNMMCMPKSAMRIGSARQVVTIFNRILDRERASNGDSSLMASRPAIARVRRIVWRRRCEQWWQNLPSVLRLLVLALGGGAVVALLAVLLLFVRAERAADMPQTPPGLGGEELEFDPELRLLDDEPALRRL